MQTRSFHDHMWFMSLALEQAEEAFWNDEVPVGAVVVSDIGEVLAQSRNTKEKKHDPCGHAEILALTKAGKSLKQWRLTGATVYVTLEPCPMCLAAMIHARIGHLIFGAYDQKGGAISLGLNLYKDTRLNHQFRVWGGVKHFACSKIMSKFFKEKRKSYGGETSSS